MIEQANCYINLGQRLGYLQRYEGVVDEGVDDEELRQRFIYQSAFGGCRGRKDFDDEYGLDRVRRYRPSLSE